MAKQKLTAYFSNMDQALSAETSLRKLDGVSGLMIEERPVEDRRHVFQSFASFSGLGAGNQGVSYMQGPYQPFFILGPAASDEEPDTDREDGVNREVMLTCSVSDSEWPPAADIIYRNGGRIA